jgi:hypothetical protein
MMFLAAVLAHLHHREADAHHNGERLDNLKEHFDRHGRTSGSAMLAEPPDSARWTRQSYITSAYRPDACGHRALALQAHGRQLIGGVRGTARR